MTRTWLSLRVDLISGRGEDHWPRPGRILAAARIQTFAQLAESIDDAFARWDRAHLHLFTLTENTPITPISWWDGEPPDGALDGRTTRLSHLRAGEQFAYVFDLGDRWAHLCTVAERRIDPQQELGVTPERLLPFWGWGQIPDQYARAWDCDDGESPAPNEPWPALPDLPPLLPEWGNHPRGR